MFNQFFSTWLRRPAAQDSAVVVVVALGAALALITTLVLAV